MPSWKKVIVSGSNAVLNTVTASFLGNLTGTSSFATTASFANLAACSNDIKVTNWDQPDPGQTFYYTEVLSLSTACQDLTTLDTFGLQYRSTPNTHYLGTNFVVTGSIQAGSSVSAGNENTLILGPPPAGGSGEGGQLLLAAPGGTYTSASMWDNWQNYARLLRGTNAGSDAVVAQWNMHSKQMALPQYNTTSAFPGTVVGLLAFDSSGNILTTTTGSGGGGSLSGGATNYLARWASATALTTGSVYDTGTSVGVGTTSPAYKLDVSGDIRSTGAIYANANGALYFQGGDDVALYDINLANHLGVYGAQDSTIATIKLGSGGGTVSGRGGNIGINTLSPTSASLTVNGNVWANSFTGSLFGTASFAVTAATASTADNFYVRGNVGVGTTSPSERLHVSGNIYLGTGNQSVKYRTATNWDYYLNANNDDFRIYDSDTTYFLQAVYNGGTTNKYLSLLNTLTVRNNGNVGIGTTNPTLARLQILGNVSASAYTGSLFGTASFAVTASYSNRAKLADSASYSLVTYEDQPSQGAQYWPTIATTYGTQYTGLLSDSRLTYFTDNGTLYSPSFSGSFTGSVTNATSASFAPNFANTNLSLNNDRTHNLNGNNLTFTATSDESIVFDHSSGGTFEINGSPTIYTTGQLLHSVSSATGNIGIGTQTTTARLHVSGTTGVLLRAQNGSTSVLIVSSSGCVGIGTTNAIGTLTISGNGGQNLYAGTLRVVNTATTNAWGYIGLPDDATTQAAANNYYLIGRTANITNRVMSFHIPNASDYGGGSQPSFGYYSTGADLLFSIEASTGVTYHKGNVGIGVTNPALRLDIVDNGAKTAGIDEALIRIRSTDQYGASIHMSGSSNWRIISTGGGSNPGGGDLGFYSDNGSAYRMVIQGSDGNVGIGTTAPSAELEVIAGATTTTKFSNNQTQFVSEFGSTGNSQYADILLRTNAGTGEIFKAGTGYTSYGGPKALNIYNEQAGIHFFPEGTGTAVMSITGSNVGIGSTNPAQKLDVNGAIRATLSAVNQANLVMYNSSTGLLTYLATSSFSVVSSSYAVSSSFSTFAATANYATSAGSAGTATNADNAYVATTTDNQNFSLVLALPGHDEYEQLKADSANSSYNPSTGTLTAVRLVETSALKYKDNIESLGSTLDQVLKLRGVSFTKKNTGEQQIGFIADEIEKEFPQIVTKDNQGEIHGLSYQRMTAVLLESVKDLNSKIEAQNLFIKDLLDRIEKLENK